MTTCRKSNLKSSDPKETILQGHIISFNTADKVERRRKCRNKKKGGEADNCLVKTNPGINYAGEMHPIDRRLAELGQKRGWLASKTGISVGHIGAICRREARLIPGSAVQGKLCWILNIDLNQILGLKTTGQK